MLREEIIQGLYRGDSKAIKEAIKILEREPDEDTISRADAVRVASGYCHPANIAKELAKLPPVTPIRPKGHWQVKDTYPQECECWDCSECQETVFEKSNFCPNCGADMREV